MHHGRLGPQREQRQAAVGGQRGGQRRPGRGREQVALEGPAALRRAARGSRAAARVIPITRAARHQHRREPRRHGDAQQQRHGEMQPQRHRAGASPPAIQRARPASGVGAPRQSACSTAISAAAATSRPMPSASSRRARAAPPPPPRPAGIREANSMKGGMPAIASDGDGQPPAQRRMRGHQPADIGDLLAALELRRAADAEEDRALDQRMPDQVQQPGEVRRRAAQAEGEGGDAHVLDASSRRRSAAHRAAATAPAPPAARRRGRAPSGTAPGATASGIGADDRLGAQHRHHRRVQQQARQHGGDRHRPLGIGIRQPGMQRHQPGLGAVADQQEDEGEVQQRRVAAAPRRRRSAAQDRPGSPCPAAAARRGTARWCRTAPARCRRRTG